MLTCHRNDTDLIQLDPLRTHNVVQGEDQVVDIELDKGTMLKPMQSGYTPIGAKSLWDRTGDLCHTSEGPLKVEPQTRPLSTPFVSMYLSLYSFTTGNMTSNRLRDSSDGYFTDISNDTER